MKTFYQTQTNDCGVAVTQSLVHHFYKIKVPYSEIFFKAKLDQTGINLVDFEKLNARFGIKIDSYACSFQEFLELPDKRYYVIMKKNEECFHYCIIYKVWDRHIVYDPSDKIRILNNDVIASFFFPVSF